MQQITDWLNTLGLSEYAQRFADNGIDLRSSNLHSRFGRFVSARKIPFPGNGDFGSKRRGSSASCGGRSSICCWRDRSTSFNRVVVLPCVGRARPRMLPVGVAVILTPAH
jgi:SAM domain (Sterile alpha motif)